MADVSPNTLQGLLLPLGATLSDDTSASQAGSEPGGVTDVSAIQSNMEIDPSGSQGDDSFDLLALRGGFPGPSGRGEFAWKLSTDAADEYRGYDPPSAVTGLESEDSDVIDQHTITLTDGETVVTAETQLSGGDYFIRVKRRLPDGSYDNYDISLGSQFFVGQPYPCLCRVPSPTGGDRYLLFYWEDRSSSNYAQIVMRYSDDDCDTWTLGERACLLEAMDSRATFGAGNPGHWPGRLRAAYKDGQILLMSSVIMSNTTPASQAVFKQWASDDLGASFALIDTWSGVAGADDENAGAYHDIIVYGGYFLIYYLDVKFGYVPCLRRIASAQVPSSSVPPETVTPSASGAWAIYSGGLFSDGDLAAWVTDYGKIYIAGRLAPLLNTQWRGVIMESKSINDFGFMGSGKLYSYTGTLWEGLTTSTTYLERMSGTQQGGRSVLLGISDTSAASYDDALRYVFLGGYTQVTLPYYDETQNNRGRMTFERVYLPWDTPSTLGWTSSGAGTDTVNINDLGISTSSNVRYHEYQPAGAVDEGMVVLADFKTTNVANLLTDKAAIRMVLDDGSEDYDVSIRISTTGARLYDNNAGAAVGADLTHTGGYLQFLVGLADGDIYVWWRYADTAPDDRQWELAWSSTSLTDGGGGAGNNIVRFGNHDPLAAATSNWRFVGVQTEQDDIGDGLSGGQANPDDLAGMPFNVDPVFISEGLKVRSVDGPAMREDAWELAPVYQYPLEALATASPLETWRSQDETQQILVWDISSAGADQALRSTVIALHIEGANWRTAILRAKTFAGAYTILAAIDLATGLTGLSYDRAGDFIRPRAGSASSTEWLTMDELQGGSADLGSGKIRHIDTHDPGKWVATLTGLQMRIKLDGIDGTEAANGTCSLWAPGGVIIVPGVTSDYEQIELVIGAQTTADGYIEAGVCRLMYLLPFARRYDWGRMLSTEANTELDELASGARYARRMGPTRRQVRWSWTSPVDQSQAYDPSVTADVIGMINNQPLAAPADTPMSMDALVDRVGGELTPVVYLPKVPRGSSPVHLLRRVERLYGRIGNTVDVESVLGEEGVSEYSRIQTMTITEETG